MKEWAVELVIGILLIVLGAFGTGFGSPAMPSGGPKTIYPMTLAGRIILISFGVLIGFLGLTEWLRS